jgi:hypothetical protein
MVPATMGRKAMVAVLCAVVVCPFAVLMSTQSARADEPVPLGQVPQTDSQPDSQPAADAGGGGDQPPGDWSGEDWSGHGWSDNGSSAGDPSAGNTPSDGTSGGEWLDNASTADWTWDDWFWEDGSASAPPADPSPADASASEAPNTDTPATGDTTPVTTLLAAATTLATDLLAAPTMSVSGTSVSWTPTSGVSSYVFVRKLPGQAAQYSVVNGTSATPPVVAGQTVSYGVRTNVSGSAWANEVSIAYSGSSTPPPPTPPPTPQPVDGTFQMGIVAGSAHSYELSFLKQLGVHTARIEFGVGTSASSLASDVDAYARAGIRPLLLATFGGRTPTTAEAQNLGSWAAAYGPGGTFWQGKSYPANTAVTDIEFGNETGYSYQFSDNSLATYASRAATYALRARDAANAVRAANARVGLLVQGDNAVNQTAWMTNMLKAAPTLDDLVAGWTIHPYGPSWASRIDSTINSAKSAGARDLPIWITEWGLSTDNGRCLSDNYGFDKCMTYSSAASTLHSTLAGLQSRYGSRLGAFFLYQAHDQYASGTQTGREAYFGALQSNGSTKGAYTTEVKADLAAN